MKKNIFSKLIMAVAVVLMPLALSSCDNEDNWFTEAVTISGPGVVHHEASLEIGQTLQLKATKGILISGTGFTWSSSDESVVTIDQNGLVKAVGPGSAVITARTTGDIVSNIGQIVVNVNNLALNIINDNVDQSEAE